MKSKNEQEIELAAAFYTLLRETLIGFSAYRPDERALALRRQLQYITARMLEDSSVRFPNLFSRIEYLCRTFNAPDAVRANLHQLRVVTKRQSTREVSSHDVDAGFTALAQLIARVYDVAVPNDLPQVELKKHQPRTEERTTRFRELLAVVYECVADGLRITADTRDAEVSARIRFAEHPRFEETLRRCVPGDTLSLIDVTDTDPAGESILRARLVVYQPDYLLDVSGLAACFQKLANTEVASSALWFINRLSSSDSTVQLFLGNLVNGFFDQLVYAADSPPEFKALFAESFSWFPLEYLTHFPEDQALVDFMRGSAWSQYTNLLRVVQNDLPKLRPPVPPREPLIEPSFMSPDLGLQGRLDLLHLGDSHATIVELKSGKLPWPPDDLDAVNEAHAAQARMYQMLIHQVLKLEYSAIHVYLLYSAGQVPGSNLRYITRFSAMEQRIIALRNAIVHGERQLAEAENVDAVVALLQTFNYASCGIPADARIPGWFSSNFDHFQSSLTLLKALERDYLAVYLRFIANEQWLARLGDGKHRLGHAALWNKDDERASDAADRLAPLVMVENRLHMSPPRMVLRIASETADDHDFRRGDICVLYPIDEPNSTAVARQVIKAYLVEEPDEANRLVLGFRNAQHHTALFAAHTHWAIEHDYMDQSFQTMQRELFAFVTHNDRMQQLLLGNLPPALPQRLTPVEPQVNDASNEASKLELRDLLTRAVHAPDYFILIGPPGTGKTSMFLANYIKAVHDRNENILLLAYTNRAVDEICEAIESALGAGKHYIRIGSSTSCDPRFEDKLLHHLAAGSVKRADLKQRIHARRVVVATVASIASRSAIFTLKQFDRIVVDEASQVLEPLLVNVLRQAQRFVLIGDDRQLPAVVQQTAACNALITPRLRKAGVVDLRSSLFERMLGLAQEGGHHHAWGSLSFQGRMHPEISNFVSRQWYGSRLHPADRPHQKEPDELGIDGPPVLNKRMSFIASGDRDPGVNRKVHPQEAAIAASYALALIEKHHLQPAEVAARIGIIAPYRNQIGRIKALLKQSGVAGAGDITVDTVERFQGSQRDFIVYSTTVNALDQLHFLTSNTRDSIEGDAVIEVDRKLNVAITRARMQFVLVGKAELLKHSAQYAALIDYIGAHGALMSGHEWLTRYGSNADLLTLTEID